MEKKLKTGFTTGTCAAAAAKAALIAIIGQRKIRSVDVILPNGTITKMSIERCRFGRNKAECTVIKDGGDDPDVTHGAEIIASLNLTDSAGTIKIEGGKGVGTVTKPGLGLEIGGPAINPVPKRMIRENIEAVWNSISEKYGVKIVISVPKGAELAPKTDNPRLGITGGISILGTSGIVIPFSTASFAAAIRQNIDVAAAMGDAEIVLTTGGRSEEFAMSLIRLPDHCFIQMGDFAGYAIKQCAKMSMKKTTIMGFVGKLAKMAAGAKQTHVKGSKVDMAFLAGLAEEAGASKDTINQIRNAATARHVMEIAQKGKAEGLFGIICEKVYAQMRDHTERAIQIDVIMLDFEGHILGRYGK